MQDQPKKFVATEPSPDTDYDAVIVGAGFAGLYMLHKLRSMGFSARVYEIGSGVGGTWYWNRYPGARCDVPSLEYSYQFDDALQQEWEWTEKYAAQPEILAYANHVADRHSLRPDIQLETRVTTAVFDQDAAVWTVETDQGDRVKARFCIMATGCLSARNLPQFDGLESFKGQWYHTGDWPEEGVDFTGKRVGVIGTGSSGIQVIPAIAEQAEHLYVFQRTPAYSVPAQNRPLPPDEQEMFKANYAGFRAQASRNRAGLLYELGEKSALEVSEEERRREYEARWQMGGIGFTAAFQDLYDSRDANDTAAEFVRSKIREIVHDPAVAQALAPRTLIGCKRLCLDTGYFETYNRKNVTLVDLGGAGIDEITPDGIAAKGTAYALDVIVFATGYDAMTGALLRVDIRGDGGHTLKENWAEGPKTYLGLATSGFPNLFMITGPGSPSVLSNMIPSIEQHVEWIADCIGHAREQGVDRIEATRDAEEQWVAHVNEIAERTLYPQASSWYLGANIPGKPRVFMPYIGFPDYVRRCDEVARQGYKGFVMAPGPRAEMRPGSATGEGKQPLGG